MVRPARRRTSPTSFRSFEKTTTVKGQAIASSQKSRKWTPSVPTLTANTFPVTHRVSPMCWAGLVNRDAVGGAGGRRGEEEDHKRDLNGNPGEDRRARCRALPGRTDEGVRPYTCIDDRCIPEKPTVNSRKQALRQSVMRQDLFRGSFRNGTNESAASCTLRPFAILKFPISRPHTAREMGPNRVKVLLERFHGGWFVVLHVEHRVKLGDLKEIVDLLGEVQQLELAALVLGGGECADQFADA